MAKYFISPTTETSLEVSPDSLERELRAKWHSVKVEEVGEGNILIQWTLTGTWGTVEGHLDPTKQVVIVDGDVRDCAEFAVWYRTLVDAKYELAFYDDSYGNVEQITAKTRSNELSSFWLTAR